MRWAVSQEPSTVPDAQARGCALRDDMKKKKKRIFLFLFFDMNTAMGLRCSWRRTRDGSLEFGRFGPM